MELERIFLDLSNALHTPESLLVLVAWLPEGEAGGDGDGSAGGGGLLRLAAALFHENQQVWVWVCECGRGCAAVVRSLRSLLHS